MPRRRSLGRRTSQLCRVPADLRVRRRSALGIDINVVPCTSMDATGIDWLAMATSALATNTSRRRRRLQMGYFNNSAGALTLLAARANPRSAVSRGNASDVATARCNASRVRREDVIEAIVVRALIKCSAVSGIRR